MLCHEQGYCVSKGLAATYSRKAIVFALQNVTYITLWSKTSFLDVRCNDLTVSCSRHFFDIYKEKKAIWKSHKGQHMACSQLLFCGTKQIHMFNLYFEISVFFFS